MINRGGASYRIAKRQFMLHDGDLVEMTLGRDAYVIYPKAGFYTMHFGVGISTRRHPYLRGGTQAC